eukprot:jgi/Tetstr1/424015/TSEL_014626.t1
MQTCMLARVPLSAVLRGVGRLARDRPRARQRAAYCSAAAPFDGLLDAETASLPLRVAKVPDAGNGVLASRDIRYGERILVERPRLLYPAADRLHSVCYTCLKHLPASAPVTSAGHAFCGQPCAAAAEDSFLAVEAAADLEPLAEHCAGTGERFPLLAARLACEVIQHDAAGPAAKTQDAPDSWLRTLCFVSTPDVPKEWQDAWYVMAAGLMHVRPAGLTVNRMQWLLRERVGVQWFADVLSRMHLNVFKVTYPRPLSADGFVSLRDMGSADLADMLGGQSGTAAYRLASLFNHSCEPNVDVNFPQQDAEIVLTAARDIAEGEQLFVSYIDSTQAYEQRQKYLKWAYGFRCQCALCADEAAEQ